MKDVLTEQFERDRYAVRREIQEKDEMRERDMARNIVLGTAGIVVCLIALFLILAS